jgi:hypothetical protein
VLFILIPCKPLRSTVQEPDCHMGIKDEVQKSVRGISNYFHSASMESSGKKIDNSRSERSSSSSIRKVPQSQVEDRKFRRGDGEEEIEKLNDFKRQKIEIATEQDTKVDQNFPTDFRRNVEKHVNMERNKVQDEIEIVINNEEQIEESSFVCHCPLCGKNITALSTSDRNSHVDRCCNSEIKISTPMKEPKKNTTSKPKSSDAKKVTKGSIQNYFSSTPP